MSPFDPIGSEIPYPPQEVPTPNLPEANFADIGQQVAMGQAKAQPAGWWLRTLIDGLAELIARIITALLNCWLTVVSYLLKLVLQYFQRSDASMDALAVTALSGMLGVMDGQPSGKVGGGQAQSHAVAANLAGILTTGLKKDVPGVDTGSISPGTTGADNFLKMSAHMAVEGWLQGCAVEMASANFLERFSDLKDALERAFGMGRLARRVMGPPIKVFAEDPYTQALNRSYVPTLLTPGELVREYLRDPSQKNAYYTDMALHGYSHDRAESLINLNKTHLPPAVLEMLVESGSLPEQDAITRLQGQGYDSVDANALLQATRYEKQIALHVELAKEYIAAMAQGKVTPQDVTDKIQSLKLPEYIQGYLEELQTLRVATLHACKVPECRRPSLEEGLKLLERNIWKLTDYEQLLNHYNFQPADEFDMAQLANDEALDWQALQVRKLAAQKAHDDAVAARLKRAQMMVEDIGVSTAEMETLVYEGLRSMAQYQQYLRNKSVAEDNIQALSQALTTKLTAKAAAAVAKLAAQNKAKAKGVDLTQLETAVKQGLMDIPTFTARVKGLGMSDADAQLIATELQNSISSAATKAQAAAAAKAKAAEKHIDLSQEERAVRLGILDMNAYGQFLAAHGYTPEEQGILMSALQDQLNTDKATAAKKAAAAPKAAAKGINLTQLERLVRAGVKNIGDYTAALQTAGYDAADQQALTQYLQLQMEQDQQDLIVHGHAAALVDQLGVSLADLERAVKLSVVPIATYQEALQRAGVSADDQKTLTAALAAQIKTTRTQQATAPSVSKLVAAAGVSLATLEKDTLSGKLLIEQFQGLLAGYNVPADQVTDVVQLVQDEIDNKQAVAALVAGATAKAAAKGLDLAQITAAYKQQVITEDVWRTDVAGLGYDAANVEILFETLAATQAAATAKSSTKSSTAAPTTTAAATASTTGG